MGAQSHEHLPLGSAVSSSRAVSEFALANQASPVVCFILVLVHLLLEAVGAARLSFASFTCPAPICSKTAAQRPRSTTEHLFGRRRQIGRSVCSGVRLMRGCCLLSALAIPGFVCCG